VFVLVLSVSTTYAAVTKGFGVETMTDGARSGGDIRVASAAITAAATAGGATLTVEFLNTDKQKRGVQGSAMMIMLCKQLRALSGRMTWRITYADSSFRVITKTTDADGEVSTMNAAFWKADEEGAGYCFMIPYFFQNDEEVLKDAVRLVASVKWDEPCLSESAPVETGLFVFGAADLREACRVLNFRFAEP
jgi:hypothetical protein